MNSGRTKDGEMTKQKIIIIIVFGSKRTTAGGDILRPKVESLLKKETSAYENMGHKGVSRSRETLVSVVDRDLPTPMLH